MSDLMRYDPFEEMRALQKRFFGNDWASLPQMPSVATTDIYTEDDKQLVVESHLPNFLDKDVDVSVHNGYLTIQAERHEKESDKKKKYVMRESTSSFYRRVQLPTYADAEHIDARMEDGILKVTIPIKELPAPKKIAIKAHNK